LTLTENREPMKRVRRDAGLGQVASIDIDAADAAALQRVAAANATSRDSSEYALVVRLECVVDALGDGGSRWRRRGRRIFESEGSNPPRRRGAL
jgi:hypothetical protein